MGSTIKILSDLNWMSYSQIITYESIKLIHKLNISNTPISLYKFFTFSNRKIHNTRYIRKPEITYTPKTQKCINTQLYKGASFYNALPYELQTLDFKNFLKANTQLYKGAS